MAAIAYPDALPQPQASTVSPEERRLLSDGDYGPRAMRTIELDERQFQSLNWRFDTAQATAFKAWFRDDLIDGGAWWSAPAEWPTPEGVKVKVRRFLGAPQWQYDGVGSWRVAISCEVRGDTKLPRTPSLAGWNTVNASGTWTFSESNYRAASP